MLKSEIYRKNINNLDQLTLVLSSIKMGQEIRTSCNIRAGIILMESI